jgi:hypothetical protein
MIKNYNSETIFPRKMIGEIVSILKKKNAEILIYKDLNIKHSPIPDPFKYLREYTEFKVGSSNLVDIGIVFCKLIYNKIRYKFDSNHINSNISNRSSCPQVIFQHDADRQPYKTIDLMEYERTLGITSSNFFFYQRNIWDSDNEPYELNIEKLKELEFSGFEIGYHLNAYELADYDLDKALSILQRDISFFEHNFNLRSFVPHGGVSGPGGLNNDFIPNFPILKKLNWCYNGRGIHGVIKDITWSDGGIYNDIVMNPIDLARNLTGNQRILFLMHPQYYGDKLLSDWQSLPISREKWWRELWNL